MRISNRRSILALFLCIVLIACAYFPAAAQTSDPARAYAYSGWRTLFENCFDSRGNVNSARLGRFVDAAEGSRAFGVGGAQDIQTQAPDSLLADAYMQQGRFKDATAILTRLDQTKGRRLAGDSTAAAYQTWRLMCLAALAAGKGNYGLATKLGLECIGDEVVYVSLPSVVLAVLVIFLWRVRSGYTASTSDRRDYRTLISMAFMPVVLALYWTTMEPICSLAVYRNVSYYVTDHRAGYVIFTLSRFDLAVVLLAIAYIANQRIRIVPVTSDSAAILTMPRRRPVDRIRAARMAAIYLGLALVGTIVLDGPHFGVSPSLEQFHHAQLSDIWWLLSALITIVVGPLTEEILFRGNLYRLARQAMDPQFGAVFSAIVFAGYHNEPSRFMTLLWGGVVFALLYEVKRSIWLPAGAHSLYNLISNW